LRYISEEESIKLNNRCNPEMGDVLLSKNGTIGLTRVIDWNFPFSIFVSLCLLKFKKEIINPYFFCSFFESKAPWEQFKFLCKTTSVTNLHLDKIKEIIIPLPPLCEQENIVQELRQTLKPFDSAISRLKKEISFVREYQSRLLSDVVTGKIDVRDIKLPDLGEEIPQEPIDEQEIPEDIEDTEEVVNADE